MAERKPFKYKQAIILRKDIGMSAGKAIAQGAHVAVDVAISVFINNHDVYHAWWLEGHAKIALRVNSEQELLELEKFADSMNVPCKIVRDFGLTQLEPNTLTAIAIGPDTREKIDEITKNLKLW